MSFHPEHINVTEEDLKGNGSIGRYIFFPGSDGRAKEIAEHFSHVKVKEHPRGHNLYIGSIESDGRNIDVASISSGMGTPSLDIIANELLKLGARRFLRVGTAGLVQPEYMKPGDLVIGTGSVRDDGASRTYVPPEYPAIASIEMVMASIAAAKKIPSKVHLGVLHTKDSLFAREFGEGTMSQENQRYMQILRDAGVIATEMESSMLFILAEIWDHKMKKAKMGRVLAGALCAVVGEGSDFGSKEAIAKTTKNLIELSKHTFFELSKKEEGNG